MALRKLKTGCTRFALLLCALTLTGCGAVAAPPPTPEPPVTVKFATRRGVADYTQLAEEFHQKYPNITIQLTNIGQGSGLGGNINELRTNGVDAFRDTVPYVADPTIKADLFPLDERIYANKGFPDSDFFPGVMDALKASGTQIGIPAGINPVVAYYDRARFKAANVALPSANWTLGDFMQSAIAVNNQAVRDLKDPNFVYGFCTEPTGMDPVIITYLFGGTLVDNLLSPTRPTLNAPANIQAVDWYANLRQRYNVTPDPGDIRTLWPTRGLSEAELTSRCGLWLGFFANMGYTQPGVKPVGDPVVLPLPRGPSAFNVASVDGYYIMRESHNVDAAWKWISFLLDHQEASGVQVPPRKSLVQSQSYASRVSSDALAVASSMSQNMVLLGSGIPRGADSIFSVYLAAIDQIVRGAADTRAALAAAQTKAETLFASSQ